METQNIRVAEVQLIYKTKVKASERPLVKASAEVYQLLQKNWNYEVINFSKSLKSCF